MPIIQKYVSPNMTEPLQRNSPTIGKRRGRPPGSKNKNNSTQNNGRKNPTIPTTPIQSGSTTTMIVQSTSTRAPILKHLPIRHATGLKPCLNNCKEWCIICGIIGWKSDEKGYPTPIFRKMGRSSAPTVTNPLPTPKKEKHAEEGGITTTKMTAPKLSDSRDDEELDFSALFGD